MNKNKIKQKYIENRVLVTLMVIVFILVYKVVSDWEHFMLGLTGIKF